MPHTPPDLAAAPWPAEPPSALQAARERAIALLTDRYADDSLSEAEFEARLSWLSAADSAVRIQDLIADLAVPRSTQPVVDQRFGFGPPSEQRIRAIMSSTERTGQWTLPQRLEIRAVMSELKLDLRYASLPPVAEVEVNAVMANVRIIVPPELGVECDVSAFMATVRNEASTSQWPGAPRIYLSGSAVMSEVRIQVKSRMR
jgi:hypothetical protein